MWISFRVGLSFGSALYVTGSTTDNGSWIVELFWFFFLFILFIFRFRFFSSSFNFQFGSIILNFMPFPCTKLNFHFDPLQIERSECECENHTKLMPNRPDRRHSEKVLLRLHLLALRFLLFNNKQPNVFDSRLLILNLTLKLDHRI